MVMSSQSGDTKIYTVTIESTGQTISFGVQTGEAPPSKVRLHHGNSALAVFSYDKSRDSYVELSKDDLEKFERAFKNGGCRHSDGGSREKGDERFNKQLAKLQKRLKERNNPEQYSCQELAGIFNIQIEKSSLIATGIQDKYGRRCLYWEEYKLRK